jgi:hypothetical protein
MRSTSRDYSLPRAHEDSLRCLFDPSQQGGFFSIAAYQNLADEKFNDNPELLKKCQARQACQGYGCRGSQEDGFFGTRIKRFIDESMKVKKNVCYTPSF